MELLYFFVQPHNIDTDIVLQLKKEKTIENVL